MLISDLAGSALVAIYHSHWDDRSPAARDVSGSGSGAVLFYIGRCRDRMEFMDVCFLSLMKP
jgi:hypothetical protein